MKTLTVNAYDDRHPQHQELVDLECDTGLDISLLPNFEVTIEVDSAAGGAGSPEPASVIDNVAQDRPRRRDIDAV